MDTTKAQNSNDVVSSSILDAIANAKSVIDNIAESNQASGAVESTAITIQPPLDDQSDSPNDDLKEKMRSSILDLTTQVIENCNRDMDEYTEVIMRVKKHIDSKDIIHSGAVRTLLDAVKGRSEVNATKVKMIDVCNKVLSGGKPSMVNNNISTSSGDVNTELIALLSN